DSTLVQSELEKLKTSDPTARARDNIEKRLAVIQGKRNKAAKAIVDLDDEEAAEPLKRELIELNGQRKALERDLASLVEDHRSWRITQQTLELLSAWTSSVGKRLNDLTYDERRTLLYALSLRAHFFRPGDPGHSDRVLVETKLPLDLPPSGSGETAGVW